SRVRDWRRAAAPSSGRPRSRSASSAICRRASSDRAFESGAASTARHSESTSAATRARRGRFTDSAVISAPRVLTLYYLIQVAAFAKTLLPGVDRKARRQTLRRIETSAVRLQPAGHGAHGGKA